MRKKIAKVVAFSLCLAHIILILLTLTFPLYIFGGGIEGYISLIRYDIKYLGQEVRSGMLDYVNYIAAISSSVLIPLTISLILALKSRILESAAFSLTTLPFYGIAKGLSNIISEEAPLLTARSISTTAGIITFPQVKIALGLAYTIISNFIPILIVHSITMLLIWLFAVES